MYFQFGQTFVNPPPLYYGKLFGPPSGNSNFCWPLSILPSSPTKVFVNTPLKYYICYGDAANQIQSNQIKSIQIKSNHTHTHTHTQHPHTPYTHPRVYGFNRGHHYFTHVYTPCKWGHPVDL